MDNLYKSHRFVHTILPFREQGLPRSQDVRSLSKSFSKRPSTLAAANNVWRPCVGLSVVFIYFRETPLVTKRIPRELPPLSPIPFQNSLIFNKRPRSMRCALQMKPKTKIQYSTRPTPSPFDISTLDISHLSKYRSAVAPWPVPLDIWPHPSWREGGRIKVAFQKPASPRLSLDFL